MRPALFVVDMVPALAWAADTTCPAVLEKEVVTIHAPAGWTGYSPGIMRLTGYGMMAGPPASLSYLVPAGSSKGKGRTASTWRFEAGGEKWLYCTYDGSAAIQLSKRLPDAASSCELSHKRDEFGGIGDMRRLPLTGSACWCRSRDRIHHGVQSEKWGFFEV